MIANVNQLIAKMAEQIAPFTKDAHFIGIQTGGFLIANRLAETLNITRKIGSLNISFYRDDFTKIGLHPEVSPSTLPFSVEDKTIILVDDVLHTGRTVRAALNEIFDYGRPAKVILAILVDRKNHELPITADVCGLKYPLPETQEIKLTQTKNHLELQIIG